MKKVVLVCVVLAVLSTLTACETIKGVGRDITNAGEAIDDATR